MHSAHSRTLTREPNFKRFFDPTATSHRRPIMHSESRDSRRRWKRNGKAPGNLGQDGCGSHPSSISRRFVPQYLCPHSTTSRRDDAANISPLLSVDTPNVPRRLGYSFYNADPDLTLEHVAPLYVHLRHLSQVCATWRTLVLGSPTLWSTVELDFEYMFPLSNRDNAGEILTLLRTALARSLGAPLQIHIRNREFGVSADAIWQLLAQHSHLWRAAKIWVDRPLSSFKELAPSKGKIPLLQTLHIWRLPADCDFFEIAPRLTAVTLESPFLTHPKLPWQQLRSLSYSNLEPKDLPTALAQVSRCPHLTRLAFLHLHISPDSEVPILPALVSDVQSLAVRFSPPFPSLEKYQVVDEFLQCVTLRRATALRFESGPKYPLLWPHSAFVDFSWRSSLHDTLRTLKISNIVISATQLLECLSGLPRLESLSISDSRHRGSSYTVAIFEDPEMFLVNDILLQGLTLAADSADESHVPHLHSFECKTFMQFEDEVYLDFIASRVGPGRNAAGPFESSIIYYRTTTTAANLAERLAEFVLRKEIRSRLERDYTGSLWHTEPSFEE
ncbi:hypothetical protein B0H16DRAFT_1690703 [Mycena metata]|uniref:F-box domain-containing protein n=1 Tax=Mycena metata TaxID=1033252 RepID=A0AAD7IZE5_9AGAR|nr:hypothetical protein B0H16DRAFT_1690703 [Mycena metata]